ncbi:MAG: AAA family ATPase [Candidatus Aminicenantales bacterium]
MQDNQKRKKKARLIGLTGTNGAGKGEVASFFQRNGYAYFSLSDLIREELKKEQQELSRDNLIRMGNELRKRFGADVLARRIMEKVKGKAVIDSIRNPHEVAFLQKQKGFILLAVDAPVELRYERIRRRGRQESATTLQEFMDKEAEEMEQNEKGQQLKVCMSLADSKIMNDGSLESLHKKLEKFL